MITTAAFLGEWRMVSSENFENVMKELGVGFMLRKLAGTTKPNVRYEQQGDEWTFTTISAIKTHAIKYKLNEEFTEETMDGRKVDSIVKFENGKFIQTQKNKENKVVCVITREITENGQLRAVVKAGDVEAIRIYEKI